jgi:hypothetical protein
LLTFTHVEKVLVFQKIIIFSTLSVPESEKVDLLHDKRFPGVGPPGHKEHHTKRPLNVTHKKQGRKVQGKIEQSCRRLSWAVLGIRIRIRMFLGLQDPDLDPLVRGMDQDPAPALDPSLFIELKKFNPRKFYSFNMLVWKQCCGSGPGIRCFFDPLIRDPGWVKSQDPDPGSGSGMNN